MGCRASKQLGVHDRCMCLQLAEVQAPTNSSIAIAIMIVYMSWVLVLVLCCCIRHASFMPVRDRHLDLNLLEEILEPLGRGGAAKKVGRLCKAIADGTRGADASIQDIAALRGNSDATYFERSLHNWASKQPFAEWLPKPYPYNHSTFKELTPGDVYFPV